MRRATIVFSVLFVWWLYWHLTPIYEDRGSLLAAEASVASVAEDDTAELLPTPAREPAHWEMAAIDNYFVLAREIRKLPYARIYLTIKERERPTEWQVLVVVDKGTDLDVARDDASLACARVREITGRIAGLRVQVVAECSSCNECGATPSHPRSAGKQGRPTRATRPIQRSQ